MTTKSLVGNDWKLSAMVELAEIIHVHQSPASRPAEERTREDGLQAQGPEHVKLGGKLNFPGRQFSHSLDFALRKVPGRQPKHAEDPGASVYVPAGQSTHCPSVTALEEETRHRSAKEELTR